MLSRESHQTLSAGDVLTIAIPLFAYVAYVLYLSFLSPAPFLIKWLEGCFGIFVALVFCNIIRRGIVTKREESSEEED